MNNILVIAAHPDDEILGCGGTLAKHVFNGDIVNTVIFGEGVTSREKVNNQHEKLNKIKIEAEEANKIIGVKNLYFEELPDNQLDQFNRLKIVKIIEKYILELNPNIIFTHHVGDVNIDHQVLHHSVITATRPMPGNMVEKILFFETPSSTEWQIKDSGSAFIPNYFVDINTTFKSKLEALKVYDMEMRDWPHPRSLKNIEVLAKWRGSMVGLSLAEAFVLGREIKK